MTDLQVGVSLDPREFPGFVRTLKASEKAGVDMIAFGDSQSMYREAFTTLAIAAHETDLPRLQVVTTNPVTRHPAVVASAVATADEIAGGRVGVTYATGDSAVHNVNRPPARLREVGDAITAVRELLAGGESTWEGDEVYLNWEASPVPVWMVAEGPKGLSTAGRTADGVVIGGGVQSDVIGDAARLAREAAADAGRDPDGLELWAPVRTTIRDTRDEALDELKTNLAAAAHHVFQYDVDGKGVPEEHRDAIETLVEGYDSTEHNVHERSHNRELVEDLGLTEYLAERFTVAGPPEACAEKLERLADTELDGVLMIMRLPDHVEVIRRLGREVLPRLR